MKTYNDIILFFTPTGAKGDRTQDVCLSVYPFIYLFKGRKCLRERTLKIVQGRAQMTACKKSLKESCKPYRVGRQTLRPFLSANITNNIAWNLSKLGVKLKLWFFTFRGCPWIRVSAYWQRNHGWKKVWWIRLWQFLTLPSARGRSSVIGDAIGNKEIYFKEERTGSNNSDRY